MTTRPSRASPPRQPPTDLPFVSQLLDFVLHLDTHLLAFVQAYGAWVYGLLFAVVFAETGLVVTPFLPGDSLLFAAGALSATGALDAPLLFILLALAAVAGNTVNYTIGRVIGPRIFQARDKSGLIHRLLNREYLDRAHAFFEKYGGKAVVLSRFAPIIRTFVPFVAGAAAMSSRRFTIYNVFGAGAWVGLCLGAGIAFGNVPVVKAHFSLVTIGIVVVSLVPMAVELVKSRRPT
jgi:membrane-associated protein